MGTLSYRVRIRDAADTADALILSTAPTDDYPFISEPPSGEGQTLDPITGKVSVGAYTVKVIDAETTITIPDALIDQDFSGYTAHTGVTVHTGEDEPPDAGADADDIHHDWGVRGAIYNTTSELTLSWDASGALKLVKTAGSQYFGGLNAYTTISGLTVGQTYTLTARLKTDWATSWQFQHAPVGVSVISGSTNRGRNASPAAFGAYETLAVTFVAGATTAQIRVGWTYGFSAHVLGITETQTLLVDNVQILGTGATTATERIVTSALADGQARQQLLSRKAYVEESTDLGATWPTVLVSGYINRVALVNPIEYEFTIGESKRIEQSARVFDRITDPVDYPAGIGVLDRTSCLVGGPIVGDWNLTADRGRPTFEVQSVSTASTGDRSYQIVTLKWVGGFLYHGAFHEGAPPIDEDTWKWLNRAAANYVAAESVVGTYAPMPDMVTRIYDAGTGAWERDLDSWATFFTNVDVLPRGLFWQAVSMDGQVFASWDSSTVPSVGARYQLAMFPATVSQRNPIHVSGHPVDIYAALADAKGIDVDATSVTNAKALLGDLTVDFRITQGDTFENWVTDHLYGPFGFTTRQTTTGTREVITTRVRPGALPSYLLTVDLLASDAGTPFELDESSAATKVTFESKSYRFDDSQEESTAFDSIAEATITIPLDAKQNDGTDVFGDREVKFAIPGNIRGLVTGTTANPGTLDLWAAYQYGPLFDWMGRGQITGEFHVLRGAGLTAIVGDEIVAQIAYVPGANVGNSPVTSIRGQARRAQILRRTETPAGPVVKLLDRGQADNEDVAVYDPDFVNDVTQCGTLDAPTDLAGAVSGTSVSLTWTVGEADIPVEVLYRLHSASVYTSATTLPAGSDQYVLTLPDASTEYDIAVRHREAPPGLCVSDVDTVTVTTEADPTLQAPTDPQAFADGAGTYGLRVTATELLASVEFWRAPETAVGSATAGSYELFATVASVAGFDATQASAGPWPNDGTLVFLKARHVLGTAASDYTTPVTINPWTIVPPVEPDPPPVEEVPTITVLSIPVTLQTGSVPLGLREIPASATALTSWRGTENYPPLDQIASAYLQAVIAYTTAPVGAVIAIQSEDPATPGSWDYLDGVSGPFVAIDETSLDAADANPDETAWNVLGDPVLLRDAAMVTSRLRAVVLGGTGTEDAIVSGLTVWLTSEAADNAPPEDKNPPPEVPASTSQYVEQTGGPGVTTPVAFWQAFACDGIADDDGEVTIRAGFFHSQAGSVYHRVGYFDHARVVDAEGTVLWSDSFEYADITALLAGGWTVVDTMGATSITSISTAETTDGSKALKIQVEGSNGAISNCYFTQVITGLTPGSVVTFRCDCWENEEAEGSSGIACGIEMDSAGATGLGGGDGSDDPGNEPIPTPPPGGYPPPVSGGARPFGAFNLPAAGLGFWNITNKSCTPGNIIGLLNAAADANGFLMPIMGSRLDWLDASGKFQFDLWKAAALAIYNNASARAALEARIASGVAWAHWLIDEPFQRSSRYGGTIPLTTVERMAQFSKSLYPTWRTIITCDLVQQAWWFTRHIDGLDCVSSDYMLSRGDCATWRDACLDRADDLGHDSVLGPHYLDFDRVGTHRYITPSELRHYGGIIVTPGGTGGGKKIAACYGWRYWAAMYGQPGFIDSEHYVRDLHASFD